MFFRSTRRHNTTGGTAVRSPSPQTSLHYGSAGGISTGQRIRADRPTSAPSQMVVSPQDIAHVEQRLKIVKRSRASGASRRSTGSSDSSPTPPAALEGESPAPVQPTAVPPCSAYPTFTLARLPKQEEYAISALVMDCLDVLLFSGGGGEAQSHDESAEQR